MGIHSPVRRQRITRNLPESQVCSENKHHRMEEIITGEEREYRVCPLESKTQTTLTFDVKCKNDAHIALLSSDAIDTPMIEIFIGGWSNTKSVIRFNQTKPEKAEEDTPAIVCDEEYRRFWVTFKKNVIEVGKEDETTPFMSWTNTEEPFVVSHYAFTTGWGSGGSWMFDKVEEQSDAEVEEDEDCEGVSRRGFKPFYRRPGVWKNAKADKMPMRAVLAGIDSDGGNVYVGRAKHDGTLMPGKVVSTHKACYVACGDQERAEESYQVLIRNQHCEFAWVAVSDGQIPNGALQGGVAEDKEAVFIGRGMVEGATSVGPVYPSRGVCTLPYGGQMIETSEYEVLVVKSIPL